MRGATGITCAAAAAAALAVSAAAPPPQADGAGWPGSPTAVRAVGRLFAHFPALPSWQVEGCSGAVVHSTGRDLVSTAGHCVFRPELGGWASDLRFAPGYRAGSRPYGTFRARAVFTTRGWQEHQDPADDVAFVALRPDARGRRVQDVVGAFRIVFDQRPGPVTALGFPASPPYRGRTLVYCAHRAVPEPAVGQGMTLPHCGFTDGASGGPWIRGLDARRGGGVQVGLNADAWTDRNGRPLAAVYSSSFGARARALYWAAQRAAAAVAR